MVRAGIAISPLGVMLRFRNSERARQFYQLSPSPDEPQLPDMLGRLNLLILYAYHNLVHLMQLACQGQF